VTHPRWIVELATPADGPDLAPIYASDDGFEGDIAVRFLRGSDPYASLLAEGDAVVVPLVRDAETGRAVGMGACVVRTAWVNGEPARVGYLTGLKLVPELRGTIPLIPQVYAFLAEHTRDVDLFVTTILTSNTKARRLLERRHAGMPEYRTVGAYTTHSFRIATPPGPGPRVTGGTLAELRGLAETAPSWPPNLAPVAAPTAVTDGDVRILRDRRGTPLAGCVVWDQTAHKQYVIARYGGRYERMSRLPVHWIGYPRLPKVGVAADDAANTMLTARDDDPDLVLRLLRGVGWQERRRDFLLAGLRDGHPYGAAFARLRTVPYDSILYTVHVRPDMYGLDGRPVALDVGFL
jgi:hypothetical protein